MLQTRAFRFAALNATLLAAASPALATKLTAPTWDVYVVDEAGKPVVGIPVIEIHQDLTCESRDHTETQFTDIAGHVEFRPRFLKANAALCATETASKTVVFSKKRGRHCNVTVGDSSTALAGQALDKNGKPLDWTGSPDHLKTKIIVHPQHIQK